MVWLGHPTNSIDSGIVYGQLVDKNGNKLESAFEITPTLQNIKVAEFVGLAFGGGAYLVTYHKDDATDPSNPLSQVFGRIISTTGGVGNEITISTGHAISAFNAVSFDGNNFLVVYIDDDNNYEVKGRFVSPAGALGAEISINASTLPSVDNSVSVAFDGTTYLVVWADNQSNNLGFAGEWDLFGQLIDKSGNKVGDVISVSTTTGAQSFPFIAFDGTNYLVTWTDMRNDADKDFVCASTSSEGTCFDIYGQYISRSSTLVGSEFPVNNDPGNQFGSPVLFANGRYLVVIIEVFISNGKPDYSGKSVFNDIFKTPLFHYLRNAQ